MKNFLKNLDPTIRNFLIVSPFVILIFAGYGFYRYTSQDNLVRFKCPEDYSSKEDYWKDLDAYINKLAKERPEWTVEDLVRERTKFLEDHNCRKTLDHINSTDYYSSDELGFSFLYPTSLFVSIDPNNLERVLVLPKSLKTNKNEPLTAIIISNSTDDLVGMTPEEWLNGPNSGYVASRDGGYSHRLIGGQNAVVVENDWAIVNHPNGKQRISIALLVEKDKGAEPLYQEFQEILDTFSFK